MDDVLVVGEALVDIVRRTDGSSAEHPGGSPANVALGLGRLGRRVSLLTRLGPDAHGAALRRHLECSDVRLAPASEVPEAQTSTATANLDAQGVAHYDFRIDWQLPDAVRSVTDLGDGGALPAKALHTGSIATFLPPGGDQVAALIRDAAGRMTITYDPNIRPSLIGPMDAARTRVESLVTSCDLVKVSDEDLATLYPDAAPADVARSWLRRGDGTGPGIVVLTRGGAGALAVCAAGAVDRPGRRITVVDTVGAGDSFMSALLDHLAGADLLGGPRRAALRAIGLDELAAMVEHAITVSAITCARAGANPPTRADLIDAADLTDAELG